MLRCRALAPALLALLAGCSETPEQAREEPVPAEAVEQARALAAQFKGTLQEALMEGLKEGPAATIGACAILAPELAAELSRNGVRVGRTSHRLRNPANRGTAWVQPLLQEYRQSGPGAPSRAVRVDESTIGYVEPLYVSRACLACHGEHVSQDVLAQIREVYPEDQAVGFREGEFRGVLWVEIR
jgi:hypothetical protein